MATLFPPWILPDLEICRVDFNVEDFRRALLQKGRRAWWESSIDCPCSTSRTFAGSTEETKEPRTTCEVCMGSGIAYDAGQQTIIMFSGIDGKYQQYGEYGPIVVGYGYLTMLPENLPIAGDRITLIDGTRVARETHRHTATVDTLRYPVIRRTKTIGSGTLLTTPKTRTVGVLDCLFSDLDGVVSATRPVEGVDFDVIDGLVDWTKGEGLDTAPPIGAYVTYRYYTQPRFIITDEIFTTRDLYTREGDDGFELGEHPVLALARAEHLGVRLPPVVTFDPDPTFPMPG